jgi:hypothetical protein
MGGHDKTVELLIYSRGVDVNIKDKNGWTASHWGLYKMIFKY